MRAAAAVSSIRQLSRSAARNGVARGGGVVNTASMPGMPSVSAACCSAGRSGRLVCRGHSGLRLDSTEIARTPIPEGGLLGIAARPVHTGAVEMKDYTDKLSDMVGEGKKATPKYEKLCQEASEVREKKKAPYVENAYESIRRVVDEAKPRGLKLGIENREARERPTRSANRWSAPANSARR